MSDRYKTLQRIDDRRFVFEDGEILEPFFQVGWDCEKAYKMSGIRGYEPMTANELETEESQDECLSSKEYFIEQKFDGTRGLLHFFAQDCIESGDVVDRMSWCRVFSRRISKKTNFYTENTDSLPQLRDIDAPDLEGTVLDGELFIDGQPFKEVSSTLNCLFDKAIDRQIEKGFITFHAFDIIKYKGIDLRRMTLERRKEYLRLAVEEANSPYLVEVPYHTCGEYLEESAHAILTEIVGAENIEHFIDSLENKVTVYPELTDCLENTDDLLTPRAYYELIVATGGEGVIVKPKNGKYVHKRGWQYSKIKKFLTKDLIVIGFEEPTKEYTGKEIKKWGYWVDSDDKRVTGNFYNQKGYTPVTKYYYHNQVGNLILGVLITKEELEKIPEKKQGELYNPSDVGIKNLNHSHLIMVVCVCTGFNDELREYFTRNRKDMVGTVIEVKANELFKDTGKMRHPRYFRRRFDKESIRCTWKDHIGG